jgi:hypothetical protein
MIDQKNKQPSSDRNERSGKDKEQDAKNMPHKHPKKAGAGDSGGGMKDSDDTDEEAVRKGADIENPDLPGPDKKVELDDNPDETKRKIPNM